MKLQIDIIIAAAALYSAIYIAGVVRAALVWLTLKWREHADKPTRIVLTRPERIMIIRLGDRFQCESCEQEIKFSEEREFERHVCPLK